MTQQRRRGLRALAIALSPLVSSACLAGFDGIDWAPLCAADSAGGQVGDRCSLMPITDEAGHQRTCKCSQVTAVNNYCIGSSTTSAGACLDLEWARWPIAPPALPDSQYEWTAQTAKDTLTGLLWQRGASISTYDWSGAKRYCEELSLADFSSGWRLPTRVELLTLVDYTKLAPAINSNVFPNTPFAPASGSLTEYFWSSSPSTEEGKAWMVSFRAGGFNKIDTYNTFYARCVRTDAAP